MLVKEEYLGGTMNRVIKAGDTVRRVDKGGPILHAYLQYLEEAGMTGVPRFSDWMNKGGRYYPICRAKRRKG